MEPSDAFNRMRTYCLAKEGCVEDHPWGECAWKVKGKAFCFGNEGSSGFTMKATLDEQTALTQLPHIEVAAYVGRFGWISVKVTDEDTMSHALELVDRSYELVGPKKKR